MVLLLRAGPLAPLSVIFWDTLFGLVAALDFLIRTALSPSATTLIDLLFAKPEYLKLCTDLTLPGSALSTAPFCFLKKELWLRTHAQTNSSETIFIERKKRI